MALELAEAESARFKAEVERLRLSVAVAGGEDENLLLSAVAAASYLKHGQDSETDRLRAELSRGFGEMALSKSRGTSPVRRHSTALMKAFLGIILCYAGHRATAFITKVLPGADVETVTRWRQQAPKFQMGTSAGTIEQNFVNCVLPAMKELGLESVSWLLAEDGTSTDKRIDIQVEVVEGVARAIAYGLNGGPFPAESVEALASAVQERGLATTLYVIMLVPLVHGAPALPIVVDAHDNRFTRDDVHGTTLAILGILKKHGLGGRVRGGASDGDPKLRAEQLTLLFHRLVDGTRLADGQEQKYIAISHGFVQLRIPMISGDVARYCMGVALLFLLTPCCCASQAMATTS